MPAFQQQTKNAVGGVGYLLTLDEEAAAVSILARGDCWVKVYGNSTTPPSAPAVSPAPAAGNTATWTFLDANESVSFGNDADYAAGSQKQADKIRYIAVWAVNSGYLRIIAH